MSRWVLRGLVAAVALGAPGPGHAQRLEALRTFGGPGTDVGNSVRPLSDGGFVVAGYTDGPVGAERDAWLLRLGPGLDTVWTRRYGGRGEDHAWDVVETPSGRFLIAGFSETSAGDEDVWVAQVNDSGDLEWELTLGGPRRDRAWAITLLEGGDALVLGETESFGDGGRDVYVVRVGTDGDTVWTRHAGGPGDDRAFAVTRHADGALFVGMSDSAESASRVLLGWVTSDGRVRLERRPGGPGDAIGHGIAATPDGGFIVTGYGASDSAASNDVLFMRLDRGGKEVSRELISAAEDERAMMSAVTPDGRMATVGYAYRDGDWDLTLHLGSPGDPSEDRWTDRRAGDARGVMVAPIPEGGWVLTGTMATGDDPGDLVILKVSERPASGAPVVPGRGPARRRR